MKLNKKQKRTATIASMAALLAVVLGMGGQTFAKYITTNTTKAQTATVAKWGYVISQKADNLFGQYYGDTVTENFVSVNTTATKTVAGLTTGTNVVAPGTTGYMTISVTGKAEVKSQIKFTVGNYKDGKFDGDESIKEIYYDADANTGTTGDQYYPVVWTLTDTNDSNAELATGKLSDIEEYLETTIDPNDAGVAVNIDYKLTWEWALESNHDVEDTRLGDLNALSKVDYNEKYGTDDNADPYTSDVAASSVDMSFAIEVSVEQVQ